MVSGVNTIEPELEEEEPVVEDPEFEEDVELDPPSPSLSFDPQPTSKEVLITAIQKNGFTALKKLTFILVYSLRGLTKLLTHFKYITIETMRKHVSKGLKQCQGSFNLYNWAYFTALTNRLKLEQKSPPSSF